MIKENINNSNEKRECNAKSVCYLCGEKCSENVKIF